MRLWLVPIPESLMDDLADRARTAGIDPLDAREQVTTTWKSMSAEMFEHECLATVYGWQTLTEERLFDATADWREKGGDPLKPRKAKGSWRNRPKVIVRYSKAVHDVTAGAARARKTPVDEARKAIFRLALHEVRNLTPEAAIVSADEPWIIETIERLHHASFGTRRQLLRALISVPGTSEETKALALRVASVIVKAEGEGHRGLLEEIFQVLRAP
jgi:hypothetical protein